MYTKAMTAQDLSIKLREWLNASGKSRQWLADKLRVTVGSVNNWLSKNGGIPKGKAAAVEMLISSNSAPEKTAQVVLSFTDEEWERLRSRFSSQEALEAAIQGFILGNLYERAVKMVRAHGIDLPTDSDLEAADSEE